MKVTAYIGFGSNLGDLLKNHQEAGVHINNHPQIQIKKTSKLYSTEPLTKITTKDKTKQPWYLNSVFEISTSLTLHELLAELKRIEQSMGRTPQKKWSARIVDLDILLYGDVIYADKQIQIPHKEIIHRKFVLKPLCDLIPDFLHPDLQISLSDILTHSRDSLQIRPLTV